LDLPAVFWICGRILSAAAAGAETGRAAGIVTRLSCSSAALASATASAALGTRVLRSWVVQPQVDGQLRKDAVTRLAKPAPIDRELHKVGPVGVALALEDEAGGGRACIPSTGSGGSGKPMTLAMKDCSCVTFKSSGSVMLSIAAP
jgi:hypothetical protein